MDIDKIIKSRKSVRYFNSGKKPDWRKIIEAIDSARYAPAAGNIFTLKFILVDDKEKIIKIAEHCQQDFIIQCHYIVIVCSKPSLLNGFREGKLFNKQQAGAAIENFLLELESKGLSTCWIGAFAENLIKKEFSIPDNVEVEAIFPIGYENKNIKSEKRRKVDLDAILYFNKFKAKKMKPVKK